MARITIYKNSVLATLMSLAGGFMVAMGVVGLFSQMYVPGVVMLLIGFVLSVWASSVSENKRFKQWKKNLALKGLVSEIQRSEATAFAAYNTCPSPQALAYIRTLNPAAADKIAQKLEAQKQQKAV